MLILRGQRGLVISYRLVALINDFELKIVYLSALLQAVYVAIYLCYVICIPGLKIVIVHKKLVFLQYYRIQIVPGDM